MNDMKLIEKKPVDYRYSQKECTVVRNGQVKWYNFITLNNLDTLESNISEFTDFFFHKDRLNREIHTKKNNYGTVIVLFLNYIFFDRDIRIKTIDDISVSIGEEFLHRYVYGEVGSKKSKDGRPITKTDEVIEKAEKALTSFYYWLFCKNKKYSLKFIQKSLFIFEEKKFVARGSIKKERTIIKLKSIFTVEHPHKTVPHKIETPDELMVYTLIEIARQYDPMLAFPIALQAFAGLRRGEVCQIARSRIVNKKPIGITVSFYIDLQQEYLLRGDGVRTGSIKRPRVQLVYEAFLTYLDKLYREHMQFLKQKGLDTDVYGALILGENRKAMTTGRYASRFNALISILIKRLGKMSDNGDVNATTDYDMLLQAKMTPHSLRYFFTEYIAQREPTHILAMYRGDLSLNTALGYLKSSRIKVLYIKEIQNSFEQAYFKLTGIKLERN